MKPYTFALLLIFTILDLTCSFFPLPLCRSAHIVQRPHVLPGLWAGYGECIPGKWSTCGSHHFPASARQMVLQSPGLDTKWETRPERVCWMCHAGYKKNVSALMTQIFLCFFNRLQDKTYDFVVSPTPVKVYWAIPAVLENHPAATPGLHITEHLWVKNKVL